MTFIERIHRDGFAVVPDVLPQSQVAELAAHVEPLLRELPAGVRSLAAKAAKVHQLAQSHEVRSLVQPVLGAGARLVRSILFAKSAEANWQVAWHQDLTIAVQQRAEVDGFASWSMKDEVQHVQPPVHVLERMLTVRLHLDRTDETNGALWLSPGSHLLGRIRASDAARTADQLGKELCAVQAGDALLFRPLTLHASRKATVDSPRRVIHLEFANVTLPAPLTWAESASSYSPGIDVHSITSTESPGKIAK
jgi:ectoine hydroxylase-related dioxygenase (phytanoyl-CoA dioxygenase family)